VTRGHLKPYLYPWRSTHRPLASGGTVETRPKPEWSREYAVWVIRGLEDEPAEYLACGSRLKLVPLADVVARAASSGRSVDVTARSWPVGA
jgi:hypothetical protein